ncbi:SurA N-terminal domain-containing protein [Helicobacter sp. 23-1044]
MKKLILIAICAILNAETIDGIAIKVDSNIITLFEISELQKSKKIPRQKAIDELINEKLRENEIRRLNINVDDSRIEGEMNSIAIANKITRAELENALKGQKIDLTQYKAQLKEHIVNRELMQKILQTNSNIASESDLMAFYEKNKSDFAIPTKIKVTSYASNSDVELQRFLQNPMMLNPNIQSKDEEIDIRTLPVQIMGIFLDTPERSFTPVLNSGNTLIVFFIKSKGGKEILPFESAKTMVMQKYSQARESEILNEYFAKIKANTRIEIVRE